MTSQSATSRLAVLNNLPNTMEESFVLVADTWNGILIKTTADTGRRFEEVSFTLTTSYNLVSVLEWNLNDLDFDRVSIGITWRHISCKSVAGSFGRLVMEWSETQPRLQKQVLGKKHFVDT